MKRVTKEEFETFIKNYPRKLETNFIMNWLDYYDFQNDKPKDWEELIKCKVARKYFNAFGDDEYYIKGDSNET